MVYLGFKSLYSISMSNITLIINKLAKNLILPILAIFLVLGAYWGTLRMIFWGVNFTGHVNKCSSFISSEKQLAQREKLGLN